MSNKSICPICKKKYTDILKHFVLAHDIQNMEHLIEEIEKIEKKESIKIMFKNYVEELKKKIKIDEITTKDYRELIMKWSKEHKKDE